MSCSIHPFGCESLKTEDCFACGEPVDDDEYLCSCGLINYCSLDCQTSEWPEHRDVCLTIKRRHLEVHHEAQNLELEEEYEDEALEQYLDAVYFYIQSILKVPTILAMKQALHWSVGIIDHLASGFDIYQHDQLEMAFEDFLAQRPKNVWQLVPHFQLVLGQTQKCYNLIDWEARRIFDHDHAPYTMKEDCKILGSDTVDYICRSRMMFKIPLSHRVALTFLKIGQLLDLKAGMATAAAFQECSKLPLEICRMVEESLLENILGDEYKVMDQSQRSGLTDELFSQIEKMFKSVAQERRDFWPVFLHLNANLAECNPRAVQSIRKRERWLEYAEKAWWDRPESFEIIDQLYAKNKANIGGIIEDEDDDDEDDEDFEDDFPSDDEDDDDDEEGDEEDDDIDDEEDGIPLNIHGLPVGLVPGYDDEDDYGPYF